MLKKIMLLAIGLFCAVSTSVFAAYSYFEDYESEGYDTKLMSYVIKSTTAGGFGSVAYDEENNNHYFNFGNNFNSSEYTEGDTYLQIPYVDLTEGKFVFGFSIKYLGASGNGGNLNITFRHADNSSTISLMTFPKGGTVKYLSGFNTDSANVTTEKLDVFSWQHYKFVIDIPNDKVEVYRNGNRVAQVSNFKNSSTFLNTYNYSKLWIRIHGTTSKTIAEDSTGNYVSFAVDDIFAFNDTGVDNTLLFGTGSMFEENDDSVYDVGGMRKGSMTFKFVADNPGDTDQNISILRAVYDSDGRMIEFSKSDPYTIKKGEQKFIEYNFESQHNDKDKSMKIMFLNNTNEIKPLAAAREYTGVGELSPRASTILADLKKTHPDNSHPRLWVTQDKFDELAVLVEDTEPYKTWYKKIISSANSVVNKTTLPSYDDTDELRLKSAGTVCDNLMKLSFAYKMTGEEKYIEAIKLQIDNAASWTDWNPKHFLDTATVAQGFAFAYDWCYDYWQLAENAAYKELIITKIHDYALVEVMKKYENSSPWGNNWNMVCNGGIAQAATAIMDEPGYEDIASKCVAYGLDWLLTVTEDFAPDGGWYEGIGYWNYLMQFMSVHFSTLESAFGTDYDYPEITGISETGYFPIAMIGKKQTFNVHDASVGNFSCPYWMYLAQKFDSTDFANYRYRQINEYGYTPNMYDLLWFEPELVADYDTYEFEKKDFLFEEVSIASFKDAYFGDNTVYAVLHGGKNNFAHGQLDAGNFIYEYNGTRWAMDLGGDNYNLQGYFNTSITDEKSRWAYYRNRAEGHNTIILNPGLGADQNPSIDSRFEEFVTDEAYGMAVLDMSDVLADYTSSAKRGMYLDKATGTLLIRDEITFDTQDNLLYWFMHTKAEIDVAEDGKSAILTSGSERLWVGIIDGEAAFTKETATPLESSPNPDEWEENLDNLGDSINPKTQNANEGITKLQIKKEALSGNYNLTVMLSPLADGETEPVEIPTNVSISSWR